MAKIKYFNGTTELRDPHGMDNAKFVAAFPGVKGLRYDGFQMKVGYPVTGGALLPIERAIEYKSNPSRHECDARCINATGRIMRCECSCGGKNHGKGAFNCSAIAA
jgi:hypothetical protein